MRSFRKWILLNIFFNFNVEDIHLKSNPNSQGSVMFNVFGRTNDNYIIMFNIVYSSEIEMKYCNYVIISIKFLLG